MKTCKEVEPALLAVIRRLEPGFKPKWDKDRKACPPIYFYTVNSWRTFSVTIEPCNVHPKTGELIQVAWTRFFVREQYVTGDGKIAWDFIIPANENNDNVSSIPFSSLFSNECRSHSLLALLDNIVMWIFTYIAPVDVYNLYPTKKYYPHIHTEFSLEFTNIEQKCRDTSGEDKINLEFDFNDFKNWAADQVTKHAVGLRNLVYHNWKLIPKDVRETAKKQFAPYLQVPIVVDVASFVEEYVLSILNTRHDSIKVRYICTTAGGSLEVAVYVKDNDSNAVIDADTASDMHTGYDSCEYLLPFNKNDLKLTETKLINSYEDIYCN